MKKATVPAQVGEFGENLMHAVEKATGHCLDLTPETLPILDFYCQIYRESLKAKGPSVKVVKDGPAEQGEGVDLLLAPMAGAYFGQVVTRKYDCRWVTEPGKYARWRIQFDHIFLYFYPVGVAMEILNQRSVAGWPPAFIMRRESEQVVLSSLDRLVPVADEEYYSFIMRWEVLDSIVNMLASIEVLSRKGKKVKVPVYKTSDYESYIKARGGV
ncbi:MAG: hypothetical protein V1918_07720 [Planctomycetota bacterium]